MYLGKRKICVTGSSGMIASEFIEYHKDDYEILALTSNSSLEIPNVLTLKYDINNFDSITPKIMAFKPEVIINSAFYLSSKKEINDIDQFINSLKFANYLLNIALKLNTIHWIEMRSFSDFKYSNWHPPIESPSYLYSVYKTFTASLIKWYSESHHSNFKVTELILFSVYGKKSKGKKIIDYLINSIDSNIPVHLSSGKQKLDFIHISDVIESINHSILSKEKRIWVGTGKATSIQNLAKVISKSSEVKNLNIVWDTKYDRPDDIYFAQAPLKFNKTWKAKIGLDDGIKAYLNKIKTI